MRTHTTIRQARLVALLAAGALALSACGDDAGATDEQLPPAQDQGVAVGEPNGSDAPGGDAAGGTRPADQEFLPGERAEMLFGLTEQEAQNVALEFGWTIRTGRVDGEQYMLTEDYQIDRITIELDTEGEGEPVVTVVTIELDGGPETFTA